MKAFRFTLEAVRTVRQLQENEALERYARALAARQMARDSLEAIQERIMDDFALMRCAARAAQAQNFHHSLEMTRRNGVAVLEQAECRVNAACQTMLAARQQREIVDVYCEKQRAAHLRLELREEQKLMDEFALRRVTAPHSAQTQTAHD